MALKNGFSSAICKNVTEVNIKKQRLYCCMFRIASTFGNNGDIIRTHTKPYSLFLHALIFTSNISFRYFLFQCFQKIESPRKVQSVLK